MTRRQQRDGLARAYARKSDIARMVQAARANGVHVVTIECAPDGTIRVSSTPAETQSAKSVFDVWSEAGKL